MSSPRRPRRARQWWVLGGWVEPEPCPLELRAALAARAYIRHHLTGYHDTLVDLATEDAWDDEYLHRQVKAEAQRVVDEFLVEHRRPTT